MAQTKTAAATKDIKLSSDDLLAMVKSDHAIEIAKAKLEAVSNARVALEAQIKVAAAEINAKFQEATDAEKAATDSGKALAAKVAERYAFDWDTHSYCNDTGVVRRFNED